MKYLLLAILLLACSEPTNTKRPTLAESRQGYGKIELVRIDVAFTEPTLWFDHPVQACAFFVFASGEVGMRSVDAWACQGLYQSRYTELERAVSKQTQTWLDGR
jgi:hypothetical protein